MRQKRSLGPEDRFVELLKRRFEKGDPSVMVGIGDDGAVVEGSSHPWVFSVDACVEGVHFDPAIVPPERIGSRALGAALSDLAAMGATPRYYLVSVECPGAHAERRLRRVYAGFLDLERQWRIRLIGGNVAKGDRLSLHTTVIGEMSEGLPLTRHGARPGNGLYVTGDLGAAAWGLRLLRKGNPMWHSRNRSGSASRPLRVGAASRQRAGPTPGVMAARTPATRAIRRAVRKFLEPNPRFQEAQFLLKHKLASAAMDISDGLLLDLTRLCRAGKVGAGVEVNWLPRPRGATERDALTGGEDYELLVAIPPKAIHSLRGKTLSVFERQFRKIGWIERKPGIRLHWPDGRIVNASRYGRLGWDHWKS